MKPSRLKVMYVVHSLDVGGTERIVREMAGAMPVYGIEPMVCCLDRIGTWGECLRKKGCEVFELSRKEGIDLTTIGRMRELVRREAPDILNPHQYTPYFYTVASVLFLRKRPKIVFTEHGRFYPDRRRWKRVFFNKLANALTDDIIGVSGFSKEALVNYEGFPGGRIRVIYNGIDPGRYSVPVDMMATRRSLGLKEDDVVVGAAGRLCAEKNYGMLLRAFSRIPAPHDYVKLVIAGGGELSGELKSAVADLGLTGRVLFLGPRDDMVQIMRIFDLFVLSSDSEGAPLVLLEAMASGVPVVATAVGGVEELVSAEETALIVPRGDECALCAAIVRLIDDPSLRGKLAMAARRRVDEKFAFGNMVKEYVDLYRRLTGTVETDRLCKKMC